LISTWFSTINSTGIKMKQWNNKIFTVIVIISLASVFNCRNDKNNNTLTIGDANNIMLSYLNALKSGDAKSIKTFWSDKSLSRKGFDVMHLWVRGLIHIREWKDFLDSTQYTYQITDLSKEEDYYVIIGVWKKPDNSSGQEKSHPMPFYVVRENNNWLFINPIDILTKHWDRFETDNIKFFYPKGINIDDHLQEIKSLDNNFKSMCKAMNVSFNDKIEYYKASSPEECGRLLTQPPFNGLAAVTYQDSIAWFQIAVSTTFYNPHEVMHIVALSSGIPSSNSFFSEGLAVAYGGTTFQTPEFAHMYSRTIIDKPTYIPVKRLVTMNSNDFLKSSYITYQESGSFIRYLIDTNGINKLKNFISNFDVNTDLDAQAMRVYNISLDDLEKKWKEYLRKIELSDLGFSIPDKAKFVFSMADPENDDNGDGNYKYPSIENYVKGCFDLTTFEVFKEQNRAYFRIGLQKVIEPVSTRFQSVKFIPAVVIAINKGGDNKRQLCKYTNEVELAEGYDVKINVGFGINISNSFGKIFLSTNDLYHEMTDQRSNMLTFSIPTEIIGEPNDEWKYFVGVGLTDEPTFNFSGLTPVFKDVPGLISGGNYDHSNPAFIDILLPKNTNQSDMLSNYDSEKGKLVVVKMVSKNGQGY
jgi:hypothetical protein